jgi:RNA polymerase sigma factor (sigma-70 family)
MGDRAAHGPGSQRRRAGHVDVGHPARRGLDYGQREGARCLGSCSRKKINFDRFLDALHPEDRDTVRRATANALNGVGEYESEYRVVLPGGQARWIGGRGRVEFGGGKPVRMRGVSLDITRRQQAELEAARLRSELAHLSRVTLLGELSGSLAHELNQPLGAIVTNAGAALRFLARETMSRMEELIFITGGTSVPTCVQAMKAGAIDYLSKPFRDEDLLSAVKQALLRASEQWLKHSQRNEVRARLAKLTPREFEVFKSVIGEMLNKQIAARLGTTEGTIKVHRGRGMEKVQVTFVAELVALAYLAGVPLESAG